MTRDVSARMRRRRLVCERTVVVAIALALFVIGTTAGPGSSLSAPMRLLSGTQAAAAEGCQPPADWQSTEAAPVPGIASDYDLTSFDGTTIRIHWFPDPLGSSGHSHPTVLMGPGWGSSGDTDTSQAGIQGALSIAQLWQGGFNVLTWDPRGFGHSGGEAEVDSPKDEGRDVSAMLNWVAQQSGVQLDRPGVPRVGMVGESYGGGVQFAAAEQDCRIAAIAPTIAWHSLVTSLDKNQTPKTGWGNILASVSSSAKLDPEITTADNEMNSTGTIDAGAVSFFDSRGPAQFLSHIKVPTLILQGTVDDLFTLDEGIENYQDLHRQGTTVSMAWFCGGHGACLTDPGSGPGGRPALAGVDAALCRSRRLGSCAQGFRFRRPERDFLCSTRLSAHGRSSGRGERFGHSHPAGRRRIGSAGGRRQCEGGQHRRFGGPARHPGPGDKRTQHHGANHPGSRAGRPSDSLRDLLGHRGARHAAVPGVRPARRSGHRNRPQQPDHPHSGHARREIPQCDHPARKRRLHGQGRRLTRTPTGGDHSRLHHATPRWDDHLQSGEGGSATAKDLHVLQGG